MLLAIDLGGTKTSLGLFERPGLLSRTATYQSSRFSCLEDVILEFISEDTNTLTAIVAGVAGPIVAGSAAITNLPWEVSVEKLRRTLRVDHVNLINDVEAYAWGALTLKPTQLHSLTPGLPVPLLGNRALIAPGTGLGECLMPWNGSDFRPSPSEGGHSDFAPSSIADLPFVTWLYGRYERISWERVVSGSFGFKNIYEYLAQTGGFTQFLDPSVHGPDADFGKELTEAARQGLPIAHETIRRFCWFLGAEAGNLALKGFATGGIYIGGGIAPKILPWLEDGTFCQAFTAKGRQKSLLEKIPIHIILEPDCPLYGAAAYGNACLKTRISAP
jgi:glucokinase